ncbi:MAG: hypothetical protein A2087_07780 [Spirochaetes bacterium GWD1_61_31]|nr:MAG: hypothetical protein A2Y37_07690 [Spirochaetes bacterium GWB1_60_80]OHD40230.1 MAG: hypothetical protein A2087_07780 [Spirochaetes bacterium GWD1_61_31]OHD45722.1 MAG: hypothetical protein A2Y35_03325 [Spirochaetes bacterium GWE1_60_18]OHD59876.1 MAG: hypothetical protein A2Y32_00060 [Spirochaetes bacterium GWF1_60_12]
MINQYEFRPITTADKPRILEICAKIWDGGDYLPAAFDAWVADKNGQFTACLHDGQLIGCGKLGFVSPGHAWLEGLRKDIDLPLKGVGRALCLYNLRRLQTQAGIKSIRFATYIMDHESINLNEKIGFCRIASATVRSKIVDAMHRDYNATSASPLTPAETGGYITRPTADLTELAKNLRAAGWLQQFLYASWKAYPAEEPGLLDKFATAGACYDCLDKQGHNAGGIIFWIDHTKRLLTIIGLAARDSQAAATLLLRAEKACRQAGYAEIEAMLPANPAVFRQFADCHYQGWEQDDDFLLYEFPLDRLTNLA